MMGNMSEKLSKYEGELCGEDFDQRFHEHFNAFMDWAPTAAERYKRAWEIADPDYQNEAGLWVPTHHMGHNTLLANWGSPEQHLARLYYQLHELKHAAKETPAGETVIVGEPLPADNVDTIHQMPGEHSGDENSPAPLDVLSKPIHFRIGRLSSDWVDHQYTSRPEAKGARLRNIEPPFLLAAARLELSQTHQRYMYYGESRQVEDSWRDLEQTRVVTLASTLSSQQGKYQQQHFAETSPIVIGNQACAEFLERLEDAYAIDPEQSISQQYRQMP
jgi:hypothetical protein